jgi:peptidoglycan/LPS O-acetylase OafA/YrhL
MKTGKPIVTKQTNVVKGRDQNLDLLRATAILLVVTYHMVQMSPVQMPRAMAWITFGQYGVDLFFALSGWLIGSLYWDERARFGSLALGRFWLRRWLRTIPPYLLALPLAWIAVAAYRGEGFDWGYLLFLQNYYQRMPFFLVSWSLCVEEHFYLILPLLLFLPASRGGGSLAAFFVLMILTAPVCRWVLSLNGISPEFGYDLTASHLRMEGLLLGFWVSYLPSFKPAIWSYLKARSSWLVVSAVFELAIFIALPRVWAYRIGLTLLSFAFVSLLVFFVGRRPGFIASSKLVNWIAVGSYSVYLTHALMIHLSRRVLESYPKVGWLAYFPLALGLMCACGAGFYFIAERTSTKLRDRYVSRRNEGFAAAPVATC